MTRSSLLSLAADASVQLEPQLGQEATATLHVIDLAFLIAWQPQASYVRAQGSQDKHP